MKVVLHIRLYLPIRVVVGEHANSWLLFTMAVEGVEKYLHG